MFVILAVVDRFLASSSVLGAEEKMGEMSKEVG